MASEEYEELEDLIRAQKKQIRTLGDQKRVQLKRTSKKDQAKLEAEFAKKLSELEARHLSEQSEYKARHGISEPSVAEELPSESPVIANEADAIGSFTFEVRNTGRAGKRRQKKAEQEKARRAEIDLLNSQLVDYKQLEINAIQQQLDPLNLSLRYIKADGDCLFSSVSHQLSLHPSPPAQYTQAELRKLAVSHMREFPDNFAPFLDDQEATSYQEYLDKMENTNVWGSQLELQALSHQLQLPIQIYTSSAPIQIGFDSFSQSSPLNLSFHKHYCALGDHYNSIIPK